MDKVMEKTCEMFHDVLRQITDKGRFDSERDGYSRDMREQLEQMMDGAKGHEKEVLREMLMKL